MSSMKPQLREAKAEETQAPDAASLEAAEKKGSKEKVADAAPAAKGKAGASGLNADDLIAAPINNEIPAREMAEIKPAAEQDDLRNENARLKQALNDARRSYENQISAQAGPAVPELQEKINALEIENANLKEDRANRTAAQKSNAESTKMATDFDKAIKDLAAATEQNKALQDQIASAQQAQRDLQALKAENQTLKNQAQISASDKTPQQLSQIEAKAQADAQTSGKEIIALRMENEKLAKELAVAQKKAQPPTVVPVDLQIRLSQLQNENNALKAKLDAGGDAGMPSLANAGAGDGNVRDQMRDLKSQLEIVESENKGLKQQLANMQSETENGQLKVAGGNWDLQQATRRYQESQREIRRLGALLEQDRVKCQEEKKDIEYMLFDPEVAKPAQITMLNSLEDQVAAKDKQIAELESKVNGSADQANAVKAAEARATEAAATVAALQGKVGQCDARIASLEATSKQSAETSATVAALQTEIKGRDNRIAILEELNKKSADTGTTVALLQNEMKARDQKIAALQTDAQRVASLTTTLNEKDARIAQLEAMAKSSTEASAALANLQAQMKAKDDQIAALNLEAQKAAGQTNALTTQSVALAALQTQMKTKDERIAALEAEGLKTTTQAATVALKDAKISELEYALKLAQMQPAAGNSAAAIPAVAPHQPQAPMPTSAIQPMNAQAAPVIAPQTLVQSSPLQPQDLAPMQQVAALPVPVQSTPVAAYKAAAPAQAPATAQDARFQNQQQLAALLQKAGVGLRGQVQPVKSANSDTYKAFSWQTDSLYGSSEQRVMASQGGFEPAVKQYIDRAKSRCNGDFAAVPAQLSAPAGGAAEGYEIACVSGSSGSSASVLFTYSEGVMTTVAHEGRAEAMDIAMDARDKVAAKFSAN
jgi:chromosome segregation ATPase